MSDKRRSVNADGRRPSAPPDGIDGRVSSAKIHMAMLSRALFGISPHEAEGRGGTLRELEAGLLALLTIIRGLFSPGKMEGCEGCG